MLTMLWAFKSPPSVPQCVGAVRLLAVPVERAIDSQPLLLAAKAASVSARLVPLPVEMVLLCGIIAATLLLSAPTHSHIPKCDPAWDWPPNEAVVLPIDDASTDANIVIRSKVLKVIVAICVHVALFPLSVGVFGVPEVTRFATSACHVFPLVAPGVHDDETKDDPAPWFNRNMRVAFGVAIYPLTLM